MSILFDQKALPTGTNGTDVVVVVVLGRAD